MLIFDIETGPLPDDQLRSFHEPPELPPQPGEWDESSVKLGRLKDAEKIREKIEEARQKHLAAVAGHDEKCRQLTEQAWLDFKGRAALDATTGQVLVIGYYNPDADRFAIDHGDEAELIARFWAKAASCRAEHRSFVGLNIHEFDLPFLARRSWLLGVSVPDWLIRQDRYFDGVFIDLRKVWLCGQWTGSGVKSSFGHLAKAFGTDGKPDGIDGSMFADLWETDREKAIAYLESDLRQPAEWARRMGTI